MGLNVYLNYNGQAEEAMNFYANATGGKVLQLGRFSEAGMPVEEQDKNKVMHGQVEVNGHVIMFSDVHSKDNVTFGNNFSVALDYKNEADQEKAFNALSEGGKVTMPLQDTFWGAKFGMLTDKFGVNWMFNHDKPKA